MLNLIEIWEIWRLSRHLRIVIVLLEPSLNALCFVEEHIFMPKEERILLHLPSGLLSTPYPGAMSDALWTDLDTHSCIFSKLSIVNMVHHGVITH